MFRVIGISETYSLYDLLVVELCECIIHYLHFFLPIICDFLVLYLLIAQKECEMGLSKSSSCT